MDWKIVAKTKFDSLSSSIPQQWRLPGPIPSPDEKSDVTGSFIEQYLTQRETEITAASAVEIVRKISGGDWLAEEVTKAFCHRASLAHQLVGSQWHPPKILLMT